MTDLNFCLCLKFKNKNSILLNGKAILMDLGHQTPF